MNLEESQQQQHPWLVFFHGCDKQIFFSISENRYYMRSIAELQNFDEWLVLDHNDSNDFCLWNPISNDKIQLPSISEDCRVSNCLLSAPPHDPDCLVLFLVEETISHDDKNSDDNTNDKNSDDEDDDTNDKNSDDDDDDDTNDKNSDDDDDTDDENPNDNNDVELQTLYFCKPGYNLEFHKQDLRSIVGVNNFGQWEVFNRKVYLLPLQTNILFRLVFDNDSGTITAIPMTNQTPDVTEYLEMSRSQRYLIQSEDNDALLYVHMSYYENLAPYTFQVCRFDFVKEAWVKLESIGDIAIFVGDRSEKGITSYTRGTKLKRKSIYFIDHRYLHIFDMETNRISISLPCPRVNKRKLYHSLWLTVPLHQVCL